MTKVIIEGQPSSPEFNLAVNDLVDGNPDSIVTFSGIRKVEKTEKGTILKSTFFIFPKPDIEALIEEINVLRSEWESLQTVEQPV